MNFEPIIISEEEFRRRTGFAVNPYLSVLIDRSGVDTADLVFSVSEWCDQPAPRAMDTARYAFDLSERARRLVPMDPEGWFPQRIVFQGEDNPANSKSVAFQSQLGWEDVHLVPDVYYQIYKGYEHYRAQPRMEWYRRRPAIVWRGTTTGKLNLSSSALFDLQRYRLCSMMTELGDKADVAFTDIVQTASPDDEAAVRAELQGRGLLGDFVPMDTMDRWRFIVDIDGNANSWNFIAKLLLGCCMLKVASPWRQWFTDRLRPWEHYVPVAADLSDLVDRAEWCLRNDDEARSIGERGYRFAAAMNFEEEMDQAAKTMWHLLAQY